VLLTQLMRPLHRRTKNAVLPLLGGLPIAGDLLPKPYRIRIAGTSV
jgi:hypothetical protein